MKTSSAMPHARTPKRKEARRSRYITTESELVIFPKNTTKWMEWMSHGKWRETKQHTSMLPGSAAPGCCLVSFHFLCNMHSIHSVHHCSSIPSLCFVMFFCMSCEGLLGQSVATVLVHQPGEFPKKHTTKDHKEVDEH